MAVIGAVWWRHRRLGHLAGGVSMFGWYFDYPPLARLLIALIPLGLAAALLFLGHRFSPAAWGVGIVMLCCSLPTDGERNKWGDW